MLAYNTQAFGDNGAVLHKKIPFILKQKFAWFNVTKYTNIQIVFVFLFYNEPYHTRNIYSE